MRQHRRRRLGRNQPLALRQQDLGEAAAAGTDLEQHLTRSEERGEDAPVEIVDDVFRRGIDAHLPRIAPFVAEEASIVVVLPGVALPTPRHGRLPRVLDLPHEGRRKSGLHEGLRNSSWPQHRASPALSGWKSKRADTPNLSKPLHTRLPVSARAPPGQPEHLAQL